MPTLTRILLIDDDAVDRMTVRRALASSDLRYELVEASDGATGLAQACEAAFDCVLMDYRLPDVDAFELLRDLQSPECGKQAVMVLTGESDPDVAVRLMRAGALDHLAKGELSPSGLARAIRYARARRGFVEELEAARAAAEAQTAALDVLNRQKNLLFSIIAHDLRNPFQLLLGLSDVLSTGVARRDDAVIERRAQGIKQAASQAHALMEGLFAWANLQMDSVEVALEELDLGEVIAESIAACRDVATEKGVALRVEAGGVRVLSNRDMLATILRNLVGNAIKFTPAGGEIVVRAEDGPRVTLVVADTGVGMSPQALGNLFRIDRRTTTIGTAGERGSGLGLLLCRDLAERLGSELGVDSELGRGTTFRLGLRPAGN